MSIHVLSDDPLFRYDHLTHKIPLGDVVECEVNGEGCGAFSLVKGADGEQIVLGPLGKARMIVVMHTRDCDGTPLYTLGSYPVEYPATALMASQELNLYRIMARLVLHGYAEESLTPTGQSVKMKSFEEWRESLLS